MSLSVAVIGCGNIGAKRAAAVAGHAGSRLALAVDTDPARAEAVAASCSGASSRDWQDALRPGIEAAIVSVPTARAKEIVVPLLEAGKHVLCEKPLGRTLQEARAITEAARARGVVLETGFNLRYDRGLRKAWELVSQGAIGELYFVTCDYVNGTTLTNTNGVGSLLDIGIHSIDLVTWFLGQPDGVSGELASWEQPRDDNGFAILRKGKALAEIHFSFVRWKNAFRFEASGSRGFVLVDSLPKWGEQTLTIGTRVRPSGAPVEERLTFHGDDSWQRQWDGMVRRVAGHEPSDLEQGVRSMEIAHAIAESAQQRIAA